MFDIAICVQVLLFGLMFTLFELWPYRALVTL